MNNAIRQYYLDRLDLIEEQEKRIAELESLIDRAIEQWDTDFMDMDRAIQDMRKAREE